MFLKHLKEIILIIFVSLNTFAKENNITIASTTSTYDSGLLKILNDEFSKKFNIKVKVLSQGTGQAIRTAIDGNAEILLVHHTESELKFMNEGFGLERYEIMYNDYVLVGPSNDKNKCRSVENKLFEIYKKKQIFISRGDDSGTHKKEIDLWNLINLKPKEFSDWYLSVGQGMGNTLLIANEKKAYTLTDRSTWITFNRKNNLNIVCENFPPMFNQYGIILINPKINKKLNIEDARKYINWILTNDAKILINKFKKNGKQIFFYNYN
tara:strand:+ start:1227 stop:2027 length:801 start_codon:yes stop_codon:yes gene_type:complete